MNEARGRPAYLNRYEKDLALQYRAEGVNLRISEAFPHPSGTLVLVKSRIIGPDGLPYESGALHLRARVAAEGRSVWTYGVPFRRSLIPALARGLTELADDDAWEF